MDWYISFNDIFKGIVIAIPVWLIYLIIKIKFLEWKENW